MMCEGVRLKMAFADVYLTLEGLPRVLEWEP